jgi:hypothetical protein
MYAIQIHICMDFPVGLILFLSLFILCETSVLKAHECQKRPNFHTNELNTMFFCSTNTLKAPNRLKSLKLA